MLHPRSNSISNMIHIFFNPNPILAAADSLHLTAWMTACPMFAPFGHNLFIPAIRISLPLLLLLLWLLGMLGDVGIGQQLWGQLRGVLHLVYRSILWALSSQAEHSLALLLIFHFNNKFYPYGIYYFKELARDLMKSFNSSFAQSKCIMVYHIPLFQL